MVGNRHRTPISGRGDLGPAGDHPGLVDPEYLRRRDALVALADGHQVGRPSPHVTYRDAEHRLWRTVRAALWPAQEARACSLVLEAREDAPLPADHVPQHREVADGLRQRTGFGFTLAGGIVPNDRFLRSLADGWFHAVQYVRHPAVPLYTPEPDIIHDVCGHGIHLASPWFAGLYRAVGEAATRVRTEEALELLSRVYWFTLEHGVVHERGAVRAYGAALLSSYGELARLHEAELSPFDPAAMGRASYQVTGYQPVRFAVRSTEHLQDVLRGFLDGFDDGTPDRLGLEPEVLRTELWRAPASPLAGAAAEHSPRPGRHAASTTFAMTSSRRTPSGARSPGSPVSSKPRRA